MPDASTGHPRCYAARAMKPEPAAIELDKRGRRPRRHARRWLRRLCVPAFAGLALLGLHAAEVAAGNPLAELDPVGATGRTVEAVTETAGPLTDPVLETSARVTSETAEAVAPAVSLARDAADPIVEVAAPAVDAVQPALEPVEPVVKPIRQLVDPVIAATTPVTDAVGAVLPPLIDEAVDPDPAVHPASSTPAEAGRRETTQAPARGHLVETDARAAGLSRLARQASPEPATAAPASGAPSAADSGPAPWRAPAAEPIALRSSVGGHTADPAIAAMLSSIAAMACLAVAASASLRRQGLVPAPPVPPG
jgi:hypothetical protein